MYENIVNSGILSSSQKSMNAPSTPDGIDTPIIRLNANENQFGISPKALDAMIRNISKITTYPEMYGETLISSLSDYHEVKPYNIVLGNGSCSILDAIGASFLKEGDEVITCVPTFGVYMSVAEHYGAKIVTVPLTDENKFDLKAIGEAITEKTKMIFICNPNNPTGTVLNNDLLESFLLALPSNIVTVVDEAYIDFAENGKVRSMIPLIGENPVIVVRSFSKIYGLAGIRVGYAVADPEIIKYLKTKLMVFNINKIGLIGAEAALKDREFYNYSRTQHIDNRKYLTKELKKIGFKVYRSQASFIYMDLPENVDGIELNKKLMAEGIYINMDAKHARISIGTGYQCEKVLEAIKNGI